MNERQTLAALLEAAESQVAELSPLRQQLMRAPTVNRKLIAVTARKALFKFRDQSSPERDALLRFAKQYQEENAARYNTFLHSDNDRSPLHVSTLPAQIAADGEKVDGRQIIQKIFDHHIARDPRIFIVGEDVGKLGGVNLEFEGLSDKFGDWRVTDTGIREATILGQGLGAAMRGLRPIVDIQYLDYLLYAFQLMSDDLATLHYRSAGGQIAPVIVRTKGHRLEGIWHTGSPMGTIIHGLRGMHVCVPRNMTQAAGFYNTLLQGDDPALVIEVLNGYRVKETVPSNLTTFKLALGEPEILQHGTDLTLVTYGACVRIAQEACETLAEAGISVELIDVQTLLPFDVHGIIAGSIKKTNAALFFDEDVPGGATAYMMQQVLEQHGAYDDLDAAPRTLTAKPHRSPYGTDGDYFTKPSTEDVIEAAYAIMHERSPAEFPPIGN